MEIIDLGDQKNIILKKYYQLIGKFLYFIHRIKINIAFVMRYFIKYCLNSKISYF